MQLITYPDPEQLRSTLRPRGRGIANVHATARAILDSVRQDGDAALVRLTRELDGVTLSDLRRSTGAGADHITADLRSAIERARQNIECFHRAQLRASEPVEVADGVRCWRRRVPIDTVGLYVPGGRYPLISTALMLLVPATLAGCRQLVVCTPPRPDGGVHPGILHAARLCGVEELFAIGGAQAIAAMASGTETVPRADKLFGPGNRYVTAAKRLVSAEGTAIDLPAGPSEVLVIADASANAEFIAAEMLAQAEHGPDSDVLLLTDDAPIAHDAMRALDQQRCALPHGDALGACLDRARAYLLRDLDEALSVSNQYAPEHLVLMTRDAERLAQRVSAAGSVFVGGFSPVAAGDYASGTNHTLPTGGAAAAWSGLGVESFTKTIEFQQLTAAGLEGLAPTIGTLARAEGLEAHARSVEVRLAAAGVAGATGSRP